MSEEKEKVEKLMERVDDLLIVLNGVSEDLKHVSTSLETLARSKVVQTPIVSTPVLDSSEVPLEKTSVEDIRIMLPEDLEALLSFDEKDDYVMVKPRQFLGSENFAKIASVIRGIGGDYVSAGKESHFRVPKRRP